MKYNTTRKAETPEQVEAARNNFLKDFEKHGLNRSDGHIVFDLIVQAKMKAVEAIKSVSTTAPPHLQSLVYVAGLIHFAETTEKMNAEIDQAIYLALIRAKMG